jgi:2-aminobenzoate-CoA ligase
MTSYKTGYRTAHADTFAQDHLPPIEEWPALTFQLPELQYPPNLNIARVLVDDAISEGFGDKVALLQGQTTWSYRELLHQSCRIAHVLVATAGLVPGNRVLLMGPNSPMLAASWLAVTRAGGIAVTAMPLLRAKELTQIARRAQVSHVLCDHRHLAEIRHAAADSGLFGQVLAWGQGELEGEMARQPEQFEPVDTAIDDVAMLAFTSGTTGNPKATMHFHRDVLAAADVVGRHLLATTPADVYVGSPPLGFTFGLGALLAFPLRFRAAAAYVEQPSVEALLGAVAAHRATCLFTAPTMYRALVASVGRYDLASLQRCVSAGEPLPKATSDTWFEATGIRLTDGIGATEMMHIFIGAGGAAARPGATGKPLPGYEAVVLDEHGAAQPRGRGRLAVRGPTGCRYLADPRQRDYVIDGWNVTGDHYRIDDDGYFWFEARGDDMIVSAGYNIAGPEVESALIAHAAVRECAVVASPDPERGQVVKAFVVLQPGFTGGPQLLEELQQFVKREIAPFKYPRKIAFVEALPKTPTGKIQRYVLREAERRGAE